MDAHIAALRRKLGSAISIATRRGLGYRLDPASAPEWAPDLDGRRPGETG